MTKTMASIRACLLTALPILYDAVCSSDHSSEALSTIMLGRPDEGIREDG